MPDRTPIVKTTLLGDAVNAGVIGQLQGADIALKNRFVATGREIVVALNTDAGAQTVTVTSIADSMGRVQDIAAFSLDPDEIAYFGPFHLEGWIQSDGYVHLEASAVTVLFDALVIPDDF